MVAKAVDHRELEITQLQLWKLKHAQLQSANTVIILSYSTTMHCTMAMCIIKGLERQVSSNGNGVQRLLFLWGWETQLFSAESLNLWNQNHKISRIRMKCCSSLVSLNTLVHYLSANMMAVVLLKANSTTNC